MKIKEAKYTVADQISKDGFERDIENYYEEKMNKIMSDICMGCDRKVKLKNIQKHDYTNSQFWVELKEIWSEIFIDDDFEIIKTGLFRTIDVALQIPETKQHQCCSKCFQEDIKFVSKKMRMSENDVFSYINKRSIFCNIYKIFLQFLQLNKIEIPMLKSLNDNFKIEDFNRRDSNLDMEKIWFEKFDTNSFVDYVPGLPIKWLWRKQLKSYIGTSREQGQLNGPDFIFENENGLTTGVEVFSVPQNDWIPISGNKKNIESYMDNIEKNFIDNFGSIENIYNFCDKKIKQKVQKYEEGVYLKTDDFGIFFVLNNNIPDHWYYLIELMFKNKTKYDFFVL